MGISRPHFSALRPLILLILLTLSGCSAGWQRVDLTYLRYVNERQQVRVHSDENYRFHGVILDSSSISGVHFLADPACDTCRVFIPLEQVDSVQIGNPTGGFMKGLGMFWLIGLGVTVLLCVTYGGCTYS